MYEERRKYPRLNVNVRVNWDKAGSSAPRQSEKSDITKNISEGGICLIVYDKPEIGHRLLLKIELPAKKIIQSKGRIVWVKEFGIVGKTDEMRYDIGIEFLDIDPGDREGLKEFMSSLLNNHA